MNTQLVVSVHDMPWESFRLHLLNRHPNLWYWTRHEHDQQHRLDPEIPHDHRDSTNAG